MLRELSFLIVLACASLLPIGISEIAHSAEQSAVALAPMQRTVAISNNSANTPVQAILIAEKVNPGWKVVNVKEHSKHGRITMNKQKLFANSDETARQSSHSDDRKTIVSKNILERHQQSR